MRLVGVSFLDFCSLEDQGRILEALSTCSSTHGGSVDDVSVNAMSIRLRDTHGVPFAVELNWVYLHGEEECFVLGLREDGDGERQPAPAAPVSWQQPDPELPPSTSETQSLLSTTEEPQEGDDVEDCSLTQLPTGTGSDSTGRGSEAQADLFAMVDARSFRVMRCSGRFDQFVGEAATTKDFRKFLLDSMPFEKWWAEERSSGGACSASGFPHAFEERSGGAACSSASRSPQERMLPQRLGDVFVFRRRAGGRSAKVAFEAVFEVSLGSGSPVASELDGRVSSANQPFCVKVVSQRRLGFKRMLPDATLYPSLGPGASHTMSASSSHSVRPSILGARAVAEPHQMSV